MVRLIPQLELMRPHSKMNWSCAWMIVSSIGFVLLFTFFAESVYPNLNVLTNLPILL